MPKKKRSIVLLLWIPSSVYRALSHVFVNLADMMESDKEREVFFRDNIEYLAQLTVDTFAMSAEKLDSSINYDFSSLFLAFRPEGV